MAEPTSIQDKTLSKLDAAAAPSAPVPDDQLVKDKLDELTTADGQQGQQQQQQEHDDSDSEGEDGDQVNGTSSSGAPKKKKKKKSKKKKGGAGGGPAMKQTDPPSIGMTKLYPSGNYPVGEVSEYTGK